MTYVYQLIVVTDFDVPQQCCFVEIAASNKSINRVRKCIRQSNGDMRRRKYSSKHKNKWARIIAAHLEMPKTPVSLVCDMSRGHVRLPFIFFSCTFVQLFLHAAATSTPTTFLFAQRLKNLHEVNHVVDSVFAQVVPLSNIANIVNGERLRLILSICLVKNK